MDFHFKSCSFGLLVICGLIHFLHTRDTLRCAFVQVAFRFHGLFPGWQPVLFGKSFSHLPTVADLDWKKWRWKKCRRCPRYKRRYTGRTIEWNVFGDIDLAWWKEQLRMPVGSSRWWWEHMRTILPVARRKQSLTKNTSNDTSISGVNGL